MVVVICRMRLIFLIVSILSCAAFAVAQGSAASPAPQAQSQGHSGLDGKAEERPAGRRAQIQRETEESGGWVISAYLGAARTARSSLTITQPALGNSLTFADVQFQSRSFDPPLYYGLRGGYFFPRLPFLGVEAEFIHLKVFSNPQQRVQVRGVQQGTPINRERLLGEIVQQYSISHGVNLLLFNVAVRRGVLRDTVSPAGRLLFTARASVRLVSAWISSRN